MNALISIMLLCYCSLDKILFTGVWAFVFHLAYRDPNVLCVYMHCVSMCKIIEVLDHDDIFRYIIYITSIACFRDYPFRSLFCFRDYILQHSRCSYHILCLSNILHRYIPILSIYIYVCVYSMC